jgi:signal transduction histidine kinase
MRLKNKITLLLSNISNHFEKPSIFYNDTGEYLCHNNIGAHLLQKIKNTTIANLSINNEGNICNPEEIKKLVKKTIENQVVSDVLYGISIDTFEIEDNITYVLLFDEIKKNDNTLNVFLGNVSHEIRTPLNGIIGFAEIISKKTLSPEKIKDYSNIIYNNGSYLLKLITDMLDLSRIEAGKLKLFKTQFSINRLIYDIQLFFLLDMKNRNKSHILFKTSIGLPDGSDNITADELRVKQIIINLIANSIKFTEVGSISLGYQIVSENDLEFYVKDTGMGMNEEAIENIFKRYTQANDTIANEFGGTGLGLSISKEFVEMHGGKIWVESELKKGTTFYFTLPIK